MKKTRHHACVASSSQESPPLRILRTFLALLILIWHLTHTVLRQFLTPHQVQSSIKSYFHLYPIFPMMSHYVFTLLIIFLLKYHLICHALTIFVIWQYFLECSMTHALTHFLTHVEMLLSHSCLLLYIKRLSCLRERTI